MKVPQRGKSKYKVDISTKNVYSKYSEEHINDGFELSKDDYNRICEKFIEKIKDKIILDSDEWKMPYRLGSISIRKNKGISSVTLPPIDWKTSREIGKIVRYLNHHTHGYVFRIYWNKKGNNIRNRGFYKFQAARKFTRAIKKASNKENLDYCVN